MTNRIHHQNLCSKIIETLTFESLFISIIIVYLHNKQIEIMTALKVKSKIKKMENFVNNQNELNERINDGFEMLLSIENDKVIG